MPPRLITQRRFLPYFCTQFLGAFNDTIYKNALAIFITYIFISENQGILLNVAAVAFILPFFLFGSTAGQLAEKYEKSALIQKIKLAEIGIVLLGCVALYTQSVPWMLFTLFALGTQSAFFGPIKYSILPQHVARHEILSANAYVESGTFTAILLGTILGGLLAKDVALHALLMISMIGVAVTGWLCSRLIPPAKPAKSGLKLSFNLWRSSMAILKMVRADPPVFKAILANSWFWFFGSVVLTQFPVFAEQVLSGNAAVATLLLATFSIGIGLGSFACSKLSAGHVEIGLVPLGAIGISIFTWQLSNTSMPSSEQLRTLAELMAVPGAWAVVFNMTMIAFSAGMFIVPLYAYLQIRSDPEKRSRTIAANNIINAIFMVSAGILGASMLALGYNVLDIFKVSAILNLLVTIYILYSIREYFLRLVSWCLTHTVYRIDKQGLHNIPADGPALLVCNHVSFVDPAILFGVIPRPSRYVMYHRFYNIPVIGALWRSVKAIPIATRREDPEMLARSFDQIAEGLENGELICIFPEGGITYTGEIAKFQPGIDTILKRTPVPVIPMAIRGGWGIWFSRHLGSAMQGFPKAFRKKLTVVFGEALAPEAATRLSLYEKVSALRGDEK